jgi:ketosteroid isomerase-like protein
MSTPEPRAFATRWCEQWNARDLEGLLAHFTDDVVFTSPLAIRILGGDGVVRGKAALRAYWQLGLEKVQDLRFEIMDVYGGVDTLVIKYRNQAGGQVCEVLTFVGGLVSEGHATYLVEGRDGSIAKVEAAESAESRQPS